MAETRYSSEECLHCGSPLPANAKRCRSCGADADCGWDDPDFEDYGDDDFDYDDYTKREFPNDHPQAEQVNWSKLVLVLLVASLILAMFW